MARKSKRDFKGRLPGRKLKMRVIKTGRINLVGPISLSEMYNRELDKVVYLFGDRHIKEPICPPFGNNLTIVDLIEKVANRFRSEGKYLDVFLETAYQVKSMPLEGSNLGWLQEIYRKFFDCFSLDKSRCQYNPFCRFHYTDFRQSSSDILDFMVGLYYPEYSEEQYRNRKINKLSRSQVISGLEEQQEMELDILGAQILEMTLEPTDEPMGTDLTEAERIYMADVTVDNLLNFTDNTVLSELAGKQLIKIQDANVRNQLFTILLEYAKILKGGLPDLSIVRSRLAEPGVLFNFKDRYQYAFDNKWENIINYINFIGMDIYLLGRLFKTYVSNVMVYAGDYHFEVYRHVLRNMGFMETSHVRGPSVPGFEGFQCLQINNPYGMFNRRYLKAYRPPTKRTRPSGGSLGGRRRKRRTSN